MRANLDNYPGGSPLNLVYELYWFGYKFAQICTSLSILVAVLCSLSIATCISTPYLPTTMAVTPLNSAQVSTVVYELCIGWYQVWHQVGAILYKFVHFSIKLH